MAAPTITIKSYTRARISKKSGFDASVVVFIADQDLVQWEARADGNGVGQGLLVGQGSNLIRPSDWDSRVEKYGSTFENWGSGSWESFIDDAEASFVIDDEELTFGDKAYRINVYGKNTSGEWSGYGE